MGIMMKMDTMGRKILRQEQVQHYMGCFNDFVTSDELEELIGGKKIEGNLAQKETDLYVGPTNCRLGSKVSGSLESTTIDIERTRRDNPNTKVVLLHGK